MKSHADNEYTRTFKVFKPTPIPETKGEEKVEGKSLKWERTKDDYFEKNKAKEEVKVEVKREVVVVKVREEEDKPVYGKIEDLKSSSSFKKRKRVVENSN